MSIVSRILESSWFSGNSRSSGSRTNGVVTVLEVTVDPKPGLQELLDVAIKSGSLPDKINFLQCAQEAGQIVILELKFPTEQNDKSCKKKELVSVVAGKINGIGSVGNKYVIYFDRARELDQKTRRLAIDFSNQKTGGNPRGHDPMYSVDNGTSYPIGEGNPYAYEIIGLNIPEESSEVS